ncbi:WecB/TagA/CpsF family glycosyltransferase [Dyadobacter subterraneus]|uniref:WecB/TagA/CpsF family glycosyltransferase n=1 Tax=Dyadobacter subterraneus TaxID=2773304 RepID=A0ABR9WM65_9BACT|nr:WecB/TagA/CpsF family glycosyltransferase [Dyadobacter subterraneus]MBE9466625.1 WecB/TagA/CpsF family glycosyltransferase [Dyadobacter subterraneus]
METLPYNKKEYEKCSFLSIDITLGNYYTFIERITNLMKVGKSEYICVANVHMLVEASKDSSFAKIVNQAFMCTPDGMPLTWGMKLLHGITQDRVAGMDLLPDLLFKAESGNLPVYFYGGTQDMLDLTDLFLAERFPKLQIAGMYSPPFRPLSIEEEQHVVSLINNSNAKIVFVALGCPKQEKWMASMKGRVNIPMIGIGGALPVMIGIQKRAPEWVQKTSLEWLFRLIQEPRRLMKRYAVTNSIFIWLLMKSFFLKNIRTQS